MSDFVSLGRLEIEPMLPMPEGAVASWEDVLRRAAPARRHSRMRIAVVLAVAAVAATLTVATPVRSAIGAALDDFSAWLAGTPGKPVSRSEQQAFERADARTWAAFAPGTKLRRLLTTSSSGTRFELFGFRSGDDLCVKLVATGASTGNATRCAPEHALQTAVQPAVVVAVDEPIGGTIGPTGADGYKADAYLATFGIASDGVKQVTTDGDGGPAEAELGGNAFLYVADHPKIGARVRSISAVAGNGKRVALDFEASPFGIFDLAAPPKGTFHGPTRVQRRLVGGTIGWLQRSEQRGSDVPASLRNRLAPMIQQLTHLSHTVTGASWPRQAVRPITERELQPDPNDFSRIILVGLSPNNSMRNSNAGICVYNSGGNSIGGGCEALNRLFTNGPLNLAISGGGPGQYSLVTGTASDDVARITAYLGTGDVIPVALRDNVFLARIARADYPLRIVAYDRSGKVVSISNFANDGMTSPAPAAARTSVRTIDRVKGEHGGSATLRAGTPAGGYRCWTITLNSGAQQGGCNAWPIHEAPLELLNTQWSSGDLFLLGQTPSDITKVTIIFRDNSSQSLNTTDGFALAALPANETVGKTILLELEAFNAAGRQLAIREIKIRHPPG
jgi:hypothetical protein